MGKDTFTVRYGCNKGQLPRYDKRAAKEVEDVAYCWRDSVWRGSEKKEVCAGDVRGDPCDGGERRGNEC